MVAIAFKGAVDRSEASAAWSFAWVLHRSRDEFSGWGSYRQWN